MRKYSWLKNVNIRGLEIIRMHRKVTVYRDCFGKRDNCISSNKPSLCMMAKTHVAMKILSMIEKEFKLPKNIIDESFFLEIIRGEKVYHLVHKIYAMQQLCEWSFHRAEIEHENQLNKEFTNNMLIFWKEMNIAFKEILYILFEAGDSISSQDHDYESYLATLKNFDRNVSASIECKGDLVKKTNHPNPNRRKMSVNADMFFPVVREQNKKALELLEEMGNWSGSSESSNIGITILAEKMKKAIVCVTKRLRNK